MVMPRADRTRFRLLADLPLEVAFKSITYRLAIVQLTVSGIWQLRASYPGGYWICAYAGSEKTLRAAVYRAGMELDRATVARVMFERLVKDGRAEVVAA